MITMKNINPTCFYDRLQYFKSTLFTNYSSHVLALGTGALGTRFPAPHQSSLPPPPPPPLSLILSIIHYSANQSHASSCTTLQQSIFSSIRNVFINFLHYVASIVQYLSVSSLSLSPFLLPCYCLPSLSLAFSL